MAQIGRSGLLAGLSLLVLACDPGDSSLVDPTPPENATSLVVRALLEPSEVRIAKALGWQGGIPGLEIRVHRVDDPYDPRYWVAAVSDSDGRARFSDLLPGRYEVVTRRVLTADEAGRAGGRVRAFADGQIVGAPSSIEVELRLGGDRAGSLVFSEVSVIVPLPWETGGGSYFGGRYFELHNNADTTVFLDRKILGISWDVDTDIRAFWPCEVTRPFREDSLGLWSGFMLEFPGTGREYPLAPGKTALVASSATDHRSVHPTLLDLRSADFELMPAAGADNPDAPNLRDIGLDGWMPFLPGMSRPIFLADAVDLSTLPRMRDPHSGSEYARIPVDKVLDVYAPRWDWTKSSGYTANPLCGASVHRVFDRLNGPPLSSVEDIGRTATRRVLRLEGGRIILQDTNTSMADFVVAEPTPGAVR